jgi:hypothetical protein
MPTSMPPRKLRHPLPPTLEESALTDSQGGLMANKDKGGSKQKKAPAKDAKQQRQEKKAKRAKNKLRSSGG